HYFSRKLIEINTVLNHFLATSCILCTSAIADSSTLIIDISFHRTLNNSSLISAIREFDEFIKPSRKYLSDTEHIDHSLSVNNLTLLCLISIECSGDNIVPQSTMAINKFTRIDEIFCSYFPHMADTCLQSEVD
ncbi:unnamed protein product, partial [Rotaria sp. Silwood1]